jgi:membrane-bound metal-dependent hydrolase YbcI (DUF457 family)
MDPVTHALVSWAAARTGLASGVRRATLLIVVAGVLPDLDALSYFFGPSAYLRYHGVLFHSIAGGASLAILLAIIFWLAGRRSPGSHLSLARTFLLAAFGLALHILLDVCCSIPIRLLWPFRPRFFAWDISPWIDPWLLILLLVGTLFPVLLQLVSDEIGARRTAQRGRGPAIVTLAAMLSFLGVRAMFHQRAVDRLFSVEYHGLPPVAATALPSASPLIWHGVITTVSTYEEITYSFDSSAYFNPDLSHMLRKPELTPALEVALATPAVRQFLVAARLPEASLLPGDSNFSYEFRDLSASYQESFLPRVIAVAEFDSSGILRSSTVLYASAER